MKKFLRSLKIVVVITATILIGWCWASMPSQEELVRESQFTAQVNNAELVTYSGCTFSQSAPFLKITLDREVDYSGGWPAKAGSVKTNTFYVLLRDYFYWQDAYEDVNYKQILESKKDGPKVWNTKAYSHQKDKCGDLYLLGLHWDKKYQ